MRYPTYSQFWTFYPIPDTLSLEGARSLTAASDGALWLRVDNGLAHFEVEGASGERWTAYIAQDSLICDRGCGSAIAFAPDGAIWLGTTHFQPAHTIECLTVMA